MTERKLRILAIDDHPVVLFGIQNIVSQQNLAVCTFGNNAHVLDTMSPDANFNVCILDLGICGNQYADFIARIRSLWPACRILIYTMHEEPWIANELSAIDIEGAVSKSSPLDELKKAIAALCHGHCYFDPIFAKLMQNKAMEGLTLKETCVLKHILAGLNNEQIAFEMGISINTVKTHRRRIMNKFGATSVAQLIAHVGG